MSQEKTKHILLDINESLSTLFDVILKDLNVEIHSEYSEDVIYDFVFTQNIKEEYKSFNVILISDERSDSTQSLISPSSLENELVQTSVRRMLGANITSQMQPIDTRKFKITSKNSFGFYLDYLLTFAYKFNFDITGVMNDFVKICNELVLKLDVLPIDLDIIVNNENLVVQFSFDSSNFNVESFASEIKEIQANVSDLYVLSESNLIGLGFYYIKNCSTNSRIVNASKKDQKFSNKIYNTLSELVSYKKEDILALPKKTSSLAIIKKIVNHLVNIENFQKIDFDDLLSQYPEKNIIKGLSEEDRIFIKKILGDKSLLETMNIAIKGHEECLYENEAIPSKIVKALEQIDVFDIKSVLGEEDFKTKICGVTEDLTEENQVVSGKIEEDESFTRVSGRIDEDESITRISGEREDLTEAITRVSGSAEDLSKSRWELKRLDLGKKLEEQVSRIISTQGYSKEMIDQRIEEVIGEVLQTDDTKVKLKIKNAILESAAIADLSIKVDNETSTDNIFLQLENDKFRGQISRKNDQIIRMKKLMDSMKEEFLARKKAEGEIGQKLQNNSTLSSEQKLESVNIQLEALLRENRIKDTRIEQLEKSNAHTVKNKDQRIVQLEERIADLINNPAVENHSGDEKIRIIELEHLNKQLENQLSIAEGRIQSLSKKYDAELKNRLQINSTGVELNKIIDEERKKNIVLSSKIETLEDESKNVSSVNELNESKEKIKDLESTLKEAQLENKKLEQKMKFMSSQMTELDKKLKKSSGNNSSSTGSSLNDKKIKQLESTLEKFNAMKNKAEEELHKKKEEAHKLKQENIAMRHKLDELERKLSKFDKKAA